MADLSSQIEELAKIGYENIESEGNSVEFPLMENCFEKEEIEAMLKVVLSGRLTMSQNVFDFEDQFTQKFKSNYSLMVNSGSSANLIAFALLCNPARKNHLKTGDEVIVPAVCWSTSVWPIVQFGLKPVFVDVDPTTLNVDIEDLKRKITPQTKAMVAVHILGNAGPVDEILNLVKENNLLLVEDTCEGLGAKYKGQYLGTFGDVGTYSFYYSHHMTTGEGGMVVCKTEEDYDLLKCLQAHGWSRRLSTKTQLEDEYKDIDPRFLFVNIGYNLRPMDIQGAVGLAQIQKIDRMNGNRMENSKNLVEALTKHPKWNHQFEFTQAPEGVDPVWFGFCALLNSNIASKKTAFLDYLSESGVENRPIVSGNFVRQPALKLFNFENNPEKYPGAEEVHQRGFFIGVHTKILSEDKIKRLADILLGFDF